MVLQGVREVPQEIPLTGISCWATSNIQVDQCERLVKSRIMDFQDLELPVICSKGGPVQKGDSTNGVSSVCIGKPIAYTFRWKDKVTEWKRGAWFLGKEECQKPQWTSPRNTCCHGCLWCYSSQWKFYWAPAAHTSPFCLVSQVFCLLSSSFTGLASSCRA